MQKFAKLRPWLPGGVDEQWPIKLADIATRRCAAKQLYGEECQKLVALMAQGLATRERVARTWAEIQAEIRMASDNLKNGSQLSAGGIGSSTVKVAP